jgi:hypothetical protein
MLRMDDAADEADDSGTAAAVTAELEAEAGSLGVAEGTR